MKKIYILFVLTLLNFTQISAQLLFNEDFNYVNNSTLVSNGWTQILTTTTSPITVSSQVLNYNGYAGALGAGSVMVGNVGQDVYRESSASTTSKSLYASFLLNDSLAQTAGNYFFSFASSTSTTAVGKVFIKLSSPGFYKVGVSKGTEAPIYSTDTFAMQTTYLCVLKYQFNTVSTKDDSVKLYMFSSGMPLQEPTLSTTETIGGTSTDATSLSKIVLTQGDVTTSPIVFLDGIRMSNSWDKLNGSNAVNPYPISAISALATGISSAMISWTKPYNFDSTTMKTLVFVKPTSAITQGVPSMASSLYNANSNFLLSTSHYQNDSAARCVYNNISNSVAVSGLSTASTYSILVYVVTNTDSIYSRPITSSVTTLSLPASATSPTFTSTSFVSAKIGWTRPTNNNYNRNTMTTLVFLKTGSSINLQTPLNGISSMVSDSNFSSINSSFLLSDNAAKCVYKGDTNFVNVTSLQAGATYYYLVYVVRDADSAYSLPTQGNANLQTAVTSASNIVFSALSTSSAKITWTKPLTYSNAGMTSLVFVKALTNANSSSLPTQNDTTYNADSVFTMGSRYQFDSSAYCIYKGDSNHVTISNLSTATLYYVMVYLARDSDNLYSIPVTGSGTTRQGPPAGIASAKFNGLGQTTARVVWLKPTGYVNATNTTLVFLKQGAAINSGTPSRTIAYYTASANYLSTISTKYQNDSSAKCIYKGDTNIVNISGLIANTNYYVLIYVVRDADSTYSTPTNTNGFSLGVPALKNIGEINKSNAITGDADSLSVRATIRGVVYGFNQRRTNQGGIQFLLKDATGGINVLHGTKTFSYTVKEGDSLEVQGTVGSSAGLVTIANLDTVIRLDSNKAIDSPISFNILNELTENNLIRIDNVAFLTPPTGTTWPASKNNTTLNLIKSNGIDTVVLRLASTNTLSGSPLPSTTYFSVIGIGSQVSSSTATPYAFNGYQILPRVVTDIVEIPDSLSAFKLDSLPNNDTITLFGDPNNTFKLSWNASKPILGASAPKYTVLFDSINKNLGSFIYSSVAASNGSDTFALINHKALADALGASAGHSYSIKWMVMAQTGNFVKLSDTFNLIVKVGTFFKTGIKELRKENTLRIYPNPAKDHLAIESQDKMTDIYLYDMTGKEIKHFVSLNSNQSILVTDGLPHGIYVVRVISDNNETYRKVILD